MAKETIAPKKNKKFLTLFILMTVSLLLAISAAISELVVRIAFQAVLLLLHLVLFKNLLDDYYGE